MYVTKVFIFSISSIYLYLMNIISIVVPDIQGVKKKRADKESLYLEKSFDRAGAPNLFVPLSYMAHDDGGF